MRRILVRWNVRLSGPISTRDDHGRYRSLVRIGRAMTRIWISALTALLVGCGSAFAQISPGSPLGMTSPLGIGPGSAVAPTGIPLGATELASPGVSPTTSGASPLGLAAS